MTTPPDAEPDHPRPRVRGLEHAAEAIEDHAQQLFERAAWLRRRSRRLRVILDRLGGVLEATHARPRLVWLPHPVGSSFDAFWVVGGRLVDWGGGGCRRSRAAHGGGVGARGVWPRAGRRDASAAR